MKVEVHLCSPLIRSTSQEPSDPDHHRAAESARSAPAPALRRCAAGVRLCTAAAVLRSNTAIPARTGHGIGWVCQRPFAKGALATATRGRGRSKRYCAGSGGVETVGGQCSPVRAECTGLSGRLWEGQLKGGSGGASGCSGRSPRYLGLALKIKTC